MGIIKEICKLLFLINLQALQSAFNLNIKVKRLVIILWLYHARFHCLVNLAKRAPNASRANLVKR